MENINFKGIDIGVKISGIDFEKFMEKVGEKHNTIYDVIKDEKIDLSVFNINLSTTKLFRYHYKKTNGETVYVIQQSEANLDDVTFIFYLSDTKIEDKDVKDLITTFDKLCSM